MLRKEQRSQIIEFYAAGCISALNTHKSQTILAVRPREREHHYFDMEDFVFDEKEEKQYQIWGSPKDVIGLAAKADHDASAWIPNRSLGVCVWICVCVKIVKT